MVLSPASIAAIAAVTGRLKWDEDVVPALRAAGIEVRRVPSRNTSQGIFISGTQSHVKASLTGLDLADPSEVDRVLVFTARVAELYAASPDVDHRRLIRLRNMLSDDGYAMSIHEGDKVSGFSINRRGIAQMMAEVQREFDKHPITVPVGTADGVTPQVIYNGPVIHGDANHAQLAWNNDTVNQAASRSEDVSPGLEALTQVVIEILKELPRLGLPPADTRDATDAANEVLVEVTQSSPDRGKIRRAITVIKGFLAPIAVGISSGAADGAKEWAHTAIEQLGNHL